MNKEIEVAIEVDGEELTAPVGTMLIQATDKEIYTFRDFATTRVEHCGNCRMCLVE